MDEIRTHAQLRDALGGPPNCGTMNTIRRELEPIDVEWLNRTTFCFMATAGHWRCRLFAAWGCPRICRHRQ
jgi:hypothetical protein